MTEEKWLLNETQCKHIKWHLARAMIRHLLIQFGNRLFLFGGAVRDLLCEYSHKFKLGKYLYGYDDENSIVPNDLDFYVKTKDDLKEIKDYITNYYHADFYPSKYGERALVSVFNGFNFNKRSFDLKVEVVLMTPELSLFSTLDLNVNNWQCQVKKGHFQFSLRISSEPIAFKTFEEWFIFYHNKKEGKSIMDKVAIQMKPNVSMFRVESLSKRGWIIMNET